MIFETLAHFDQFSTQSADFSMPHHFPVIGSPLMSGPRSPFFGFNFLLWWFLYFITWVLIITLLVALIRWLWKKGDSDKNGKRKTG